MNAEIVTIRWLSIGSKPPSRMGCGRGPGPWCCLSVLIRRVVTAGRHRRRLPCAWSWPFAHGKTHNGASFPRRKCPHCEHIRRAGLPVADVDAGGVGAIRYG